MTDKPCGCQKQGLAILPVRYTVIPSVFEQKTPNWANLSSVTTATLDSSYQYHVRSMRNGFLYVYLPNEIGKDKWQVYTIDDDGNLYKQNSPNNVKTYNELVEGGAFQCPNLKNNETHNKFITIPNPTEQKEVYIAFNEIPWHEETLKKHEQEPEKRMQKIDLEQWKGNQPRTLISATTATKQALEQILDLDPTFDQNKLRYDQSDTIVTSYNNDSEDKPSKDSPKEVFFGQLSYDRKGFNKETRQGNFQPFGYDKQVLYSNTTRTPWTKQKGVSAMLESTMAKYSTGYSPLIIALEDPIGIALELNGYYSEIFAKNNQYRQERELEFQAFESYEYALQILTYKEFEKDFQYDHTEHPYFKQVMKDKKLPDTQELPVFTTFNQLSVLIQKELRNKPNSGKYKNITQMTKEFSPPFYKTDKYYEWERNYFLHGKNYSAYGISLNNNNIANKKFPISGISDKGYIAYFESPEYIRNQQNLDSYFKAEKFLSGRLEEYRQKEEQLKQEKIDKINSIRNKYDKCLDSNCVNTFKQQYEKLQKDIIEHAGLRASQLIIWLKKSSFYQYMKDFDGNIWEEISETDANEKWLDNQQLVNEALSDNDITQDEAKQFSEKINLYGVYYSAIIDNVTAGLELTDIGKQYLHKSFKSSNADKDTSDSIMLRAISNNNEAILIDIKKSFELMEKTPEKYSLDEVLTTTKMGKIAAYYKKIQGFLNAVNNYEKQVIKAGKVLEKHPDALKHVASFGIKMPGNERLLKIFISKPMLSINHLAVRLCNIIFAPINSSILVNKVNYNVTAALQFSFFGLNKDTRVAILQAQNDVNNIIVNSKTYAAHMPKTQNLPNNTVMFLTYDQRRDQLKEQKEFVKRLTHKNKVIMRALDINEAKQKVALQKTQSGDLKYRKSILTKESKGFKDVRLAFVIAILETYNWLKIKEKTNAMQDGSIWSTEMIGASLAMMSATTELGFQFVKMAVGSGSIAAGRMKVMSGFFGAITGVYIAGQKFMTAREEFSNGNTVLVMLNGFNSFLYLLNSGLGFAASTTYHIPWFTSRLTAKALAKGLSQKVISRAIAIYTAQLIARRVVLLAAGFWIGVLSLLVEFLIWYFTDDDLEKWLKRSAIGIDNNSADAYKDSFEQKQAFKEMLESMFHLDPSTLDLESNQQNQINQSKQNSEADEDFNEYDALMLITNDLARRHEIKLAEWDSRNQPPQDYPFSPNAIPNYFRGII